MKLPELKVCRLIGEACSIRGDNASLDEASAAEVIRLVKVAQALESTRQPETGEAKTDAYREAVARARGASPVEPQAPAPKER